MSAKVFRWIDPDKEISYGDTGYIDGWIVLYGGSWLHGIFIRDGDGHIAVVHKYNLKVEVDKPMSIAEMKK